MTSRVKSQQGHTFDSRTSMAGSSEVGSGGSGVDGEATTNGRQRLRESGNNM